MDLLTSLARGYFSYRVRAIKRYDAHSEQIQRDTLAFLVRKAARTAWGREHGYSSIKSYADFSARVPMGNFASHKQYISRMMEGERDVLWKGRVKFFATSSGTTSDRIKFIPVSRRGLHHCHLRGGRDVTASYLAKHPESKLARGYSLILSGNFNPRYTTKKAKVGDVSAIMTASIPQFFRTTLHIVPPTRMAQIADVNEKYDAIGDAIAHKRLVTFSGTPDWMLIVLKRAMERAGAKSFGELWPDMEFFAHGGMSIMPYKPIYEEMFAPRKLTFIETYNASEGFFGVQTDPDEQAMSLMMDYDVFFEFVPMSEYGKRDAHAVPLWETATGVDYAMLVSTSSGLWRYDIGDVVRFTRKAPYKFVIVGRTHQSINIWGEDLSVQQAEKALADACAATDATVLEFAVAPIVDAFSAAGHHQWLIEFDKKPEDMKQFEAVLEKFVCAADHDYDHFNAESGGIMYPLEVIEARRGLFYDWLDSKGKYGGQHKVPRLSSNRTQFEELLALNK